MSRFLEGPEDLPLASAPQRTYTAGVRFRVRFQQVQPAEVTLRLERAVLLTCVWLSAACGGSSSGSQASGQTVTLTVDGVAVDLSAITKANQTTAPYLSEVQAGNTDSSTTLVLEFGTYPPVAGTYSCPTDGVAILYSTSVGGFYSGVNSAGLTDPTPTSCTITITSYTAAGAPFEGTFSGTVAGGGNVAGTTHVITNGHFKVTAP